MCTFGTGSSTISGKGENLKNTLENCAKTAAEIGRVLDVHFTILHVMLLPSAEGERHDTHACALPPLSHRPGHKG
jgi:hypothetical protein